MKRSIAFAIAALHDEAASVEATDWPQILALYDMLVRATDGPMVRLSRAIALAMVEGPASGLAALDALSADPRMASSHRLAAARAHLHERAGDFEIAVGLYRLAARLATSTPEQNFLMLKAARIQDGGHVEKP